MDLEDIYADSKPAKVKPTSISCESKTYHSIKIKWGKAKGAKKYDVRYRPKGRSGWTTKTTTSCNFNVPNMLSNKSYQFEIRSVKSSRLKSKWSGIKEFSTKKTPYVKTKNLSASTKVITPVQDLGNAVVTVNFSDIEHYYDKKGMRYTGDRCYEIIFSSSCDRSKFADLKGGSTIGRLRHKKNGKEINCSTAYACIHDHIYSGNVYKHYNYDNYTQISHKLNSKDSVKIGWMINASVAVKSGTFTKYIAK